MNRRGRVWWFLFAAWLAVSLASLAAMFQLWWGRERVLYAGKSAPEQRRVVCARSGIPAQTLELAQQADAAWPAAVAYDKDGPAAPLSYFKYLLLPRMPVGSYTYVVEENEGAYALVPVADAAGAHLPFATVDPTPQGLVLSALVLLAIAAGFSRFGLGIPEGVACAALGLCAASMAAKPLFHSFAPVGVFLCAWGVAGAGLAWTGKRAAGPQAAAPAEPADRMERWMIGAAAGVMCASVIWALLMAVVVVPDDWDAWAIWGPKAKVLLLGAGPLSDVTHFGHPDYPLLWPAVWAFSGWCAGGWEEQWSKGWSVLFLALAAWQMGRIAREATGRKVAGWLVPAFFLSMPAVPLVASWAYAEAPLWLALVCAYGRLLKWWERGSPWDAAWTGVFAGAAALTKNEGMLFAVLVFVGMAGASGAGRWRGVGIYALVLAALVLPWFVWIKHGAEVAPGASLGVRLPSWDWLAGRMAESAWLVGRMWADVRQWNLVLVGALALTVFLAVRRGWGFLRLVLIPIGLGAGSLAVIVLREGALGWQIGTAWNRLTLQFFVLLLPALAAGMGRSRRGECACPKGLLEQE